MTKQQGDDIFFDFFLAVTLILITFARLYGNEHTPAVPHLG